MVSLPAAESGLLCCVLAVPANPRFVLSNPRMVAGRTEPDAFSGDDVLPADPYMWLECTSAADFVGGQTCSQTFLDDAGIQLSSGDGFGGAAGHFIRLELLMARDTFDVVADRLAALVG